MTGDVVCDPSAFQREFGVELILPFLQFLYQDVTFLPVIQSCDPENWRDFGRVLARSLRALERDAVVIASSSGTHFEPEERCRALDRSGIDELLRLAPQRFMDVAAGQHLTWNGSPAAAAAVQTVIDLGANHASLLHYATDYDTSTALRPGSPLVGLGEGVGDRSSAVGLLALCFSFQAPRAVGADDDRQQLMATGCERITSACTRTRGTRPPRAGDAER